MSWMRVSWRPIVTWVARAAACFVRLGPRRTPTLTPCPLPLGDLQGSPLMARVCRPSLETWAGLQAVSPGISVETSPVYANRMRLNGGSVNMPSEALRAAGHVLVLRMAVRSPVARKRKTSITLTLIL